MQAAGWRALKMKGGLGRREDIRLVEAVRNALSDETKLIVGANHCSTTADALTVGRALDRLGTAWFEEPVAPEDRAGEHHLRTQLSTSIAGGEAEFTR